MELTGYGWSIGRTRDHRGWTVNYCPTFIRRNRVLRQVDIDPFFTGRGLINIVTVAIGNILAIILGLNLVVIKIARIGLPIIEGILNSRDYRLCIVRTITNRAGLEHAYNVTTTINTLNSFFGFNVRRFCEIIHPS